MFIRKFYAFLGSLALASALLLPAPPVRAIAIPYTYNQDHSQVAFFLKHLGLSTAEGYFQRFSGTCRFSFDDIENSEVTIKISTASIKSDSKTRDESLRSEKFFWAEKHPYIQFASRRFIRINETQFDIEGYLTIRGVTQPAVFQTQLLTEPSENPNEQPLFFNASTFIKRKDYKLGTENWSNPFLVLTHETLEIRLEVKCIPEKISLTPAVLPSRHASSKAKP